ncbi:MAG: asparagine synthase-related protein [Rhizomicrobium sp.]
MARVPSRTMVTLGADGVRSRHYWSPDPAAADGCKAVGDYVARGRELFDQAVSTATGDLPRLAILCSGGLDSSAIAATAARQGYAGDITCYTGVPPAGQSLDPGPRRYFSEAASMAALGRLYPRLALRQVAPNGPHALEEDWTRLFARSGLAVYGPTNFAWFAHIHDAVRNDGHRTFLSGGQGNYGLSWAGDLSLVELLRGGRLARLARDLPAVARHTGRSLAQTVFRDIAAPLLPLGWLRSLRRLTGKDNDNVARYSVLNPDFIAEAALAGRWRRRASIPGSPSAIPTACARTASGCTTTTSSPAMPSRCRRRRAAWRCAIRTPTAGSPNSSPPCPTASSA